MLRSRTAKCQTKGKQTKPQENKGQQQNTRETKRQQKELIFTSAGQVYVACSTGLRSLLSGLCSLLLLHNVWIKINDSSWNRTSVLSDRDHSSYYVLRLASTFLRTQGLMCQARNGGSPWLLLKGNQKESKPVWGPILGDHVQQTRLGDHFGVPFLGDRFGGPRM